MERSHYVLELAFVIRLKKIVTSSCLEYEVRQPRSQGLSSYRLGRARRDPGWVWSRVSQNLEHDIKLVQGWAA